MPATRMLTAARQHNGYKGGRRVNAEETKRAIMTATRAASDGDGNVNDGKSNGNGNEGVGRATMRAMAAAMTAVAIRVASDEEGEGGKAMETVTRLAGKQRRGQQRGQWQWQRGWWAKMRTMAWAARAMAMAQSKWLHHGDVLF